MKTTKIITCTLFVASVSTAQAFAHTTFVDGSAEQESTIVAALQVPHGCDGGLATTEVQIKLPEGFITAKPQPKAGWDLEVIKGDYQKAYKNHGKDIKSGAVEIRWKGGNLPDEFYDTFAVQGKISGIDAGQDLPLQGDAALRRQRQGFLGRGGGRRRRSAFVEKPGADHPRYRKSPCRRA